MATGTLRKTAGTYENSPPFGHLPWKLNKNNLNWFNHYISKAFTGCTDRARIVFRTEFHHCKFLPWQEVLQNELQTTPPHFKVTHNRPFLSFLTAQNSSNAAPYFTCPQWGTARNCPGQTNNTPVIQAPSIRIEAKRGWLFERTRRTAAATRHVSISIEKLHWLHSRTPDGAKNVLRGRRLATLCGRSYRELYKC